MNLTKYGALPLRCLNLPHNIVKFFSYVFGKVKKTLSNVVKSMFSAFAKNITDLVFGKIKAFLGDFLRFWERFWDTFIAKSPNLGG